MTGNDLVIPVCGGTLAAVTHGGPEGAPPVLLVHGSGHNAAVWNEVAHRLASQCRVVAVDLRGHGQSAVDTAGVDPATSDAPRSELYWRDLAEVLEWLGWRSAVLVGHSSGGYAVTAVTAAGLVQPAAICAVDGFVLDDRARAVRNHAVWRTPEAGEQLRQSFGYGHQVTTAAELMAFVEGKARLSVANELTAGARPELVRAVLSRAFLPTESGWLLRPTPEEIAAVAAVDPISPVFPAVDVYQRITYPLTLVLASDGLYAHRRAELLAVVHAASNRTLVDLACDHNVPLACPDALARVILSVVEQCSLEPAWITGAPA